MKETRIQTASWRALALFRMQIARERRAHSIYWNKETGDAENSQLNVQKAKKLS